MLVFEASTAGSCASFCERGGAEQTSASFSLYAALIVFDLVLVQRSPRKEGSDTVAVVEGFQLTRGVGRPLNW